MAIHPLLVVFILLLKVDISDGFRISIRSAGCTFTEYNGYALYGNNDLTYPDTTADACKQICQSNTRCLSMDVNHNTQSCFISYTSKDREPNAYGKHSSSTYYQKVCGDVDSENEQDHEEGSGDNSNEGLIPNLDADCIRQTRSFGGQGGSPFSDSQYLHPRGVTGFSVRHGGLIDCVGMQYGSYIAPCRGGSGGNLVHVMLRADELITSVSGRKGDLIDQIMFTTNQRTFGPYGSSTGGTAFSVHGIGLAYISGRYSEFLNQLTLHFFSDDC